MIMDVITALKNIYAVADLKHLAALNADESNKLDYLEVTAQNVSFVRLLLERREETERRLSEFQKKLDDNREK